MEEKKQLRPPYASSGVADAILDLFRRIVPKKIDTKFIVENNIAKPTNAFTATDFVKWLGITDENGNVKEDIMSKLRLVGEEREKFIKTLIEKSYADLFSKVNLQQAKKDDIINYFVHCYQFGTAQAKYAAALILHLCHKYNIPVSDELKKKTHTGRIIKNKEQKRKQKADKIENKNHEEEIKVELSNNKYLISIIGENTNFKFPINEASDIEDVETILKIIRKKL